MVTIIIPGYSAHNKKWLEETASKVKTSIKSDSEIRPIYWGHWTDPNVRFDPKMKANLLDNISGKRVVDIIAKSVGILVASYLIQKSPEKIRKVIFNGVPLDAIDENEKELIKNAVRKIPSKNIICFQNDEDPHGGTDLVKKFFSGIDIQIVSKPRNDHEYFYLDEFGNFLLG